MQLLIENEDIEFIVTCEDETEGMNLWHEFLEQYYPEVEEVRAIIEEVAK